MVHYEGNRELRLACDASSYGLAAVISHVMDDGRELPITYVSRTLSSSKRNFAQIECESLAIVFGVKNIFSPKSTIPTQAAAWMQRWALVLSAYDYRQPL